MEEVSKDLPRSSAEMVYGSHDFKITGYSLSKGMGIGKYVASDKFTVGGYSWAIYFYPDGKSERDAAYVSLFIALAGEGTDVKALFELALLDQSGRQRHKVHSHFRRALQIEPHILNHRGNMWGYKRFIRKTSLEASGFLKDDCLDVHCCVAVANPLPEGHSIPASPPTFCKHFGQLSLLEKGKEADEQPATDLHCRKRPVSPPSDQ